MLHNHIKALFSLHAIAKESSEKIHAMMDSNNKHLRAINSLATTENLFETLLIYLVTSKLDPTTVREWEKRIKAKLYLLLMS